MRAIRRWMLIGSVLSLLALAGCISDATFVRGNGAPTDPQKLEADASDCRSFWPLVGGFFIGALYGAAQGAAAGASSGGADIGAIVGAGAGGLIGLAIGGYASANGDSFERCMTNKGYQHAAFQPNDAPADESAGEDEAAPAEAESAAAPAP